MAKLKKVLSQGSVSNFRQVAPNGGAAFRHLAAGINAAYEGFLPGAMEEMKERGVKVGDDASAYQIANSTDTLDVIREFEGFRETPYWDVNAHRVGYGSDTITLADGTIKRVAKGDTVSRDDAERDLARRVDTEFVPMARSAIGAGVFDKMSASQKAAVTSIAYNYGKIPKRIVSAIQSGDPKAGAEAIRSLAGDNDGINAKRRNKEAELFLNANPSTGGETLVRTSEGKLEPRLYSPYSGPLLRAHNAAAGVAYQSEMIEKMSLDLMEMSSQFDLDPDGFNEAATEYADQLVSGAPDAFKTDLREELDTEIHRRRLGLMEDKQRDTRQRAANSSKALVERWSQNYAEAVASGDQKEIEAARFKLDGLLQAREALPGLAWTEEQSVNVFMKAEEAGAKIIAESRKAIAKEHKDGLNLIIEAQKEGLSTDNEHILDDPEVAASNPELWREAMAWKTLNSQFPDFMKMTPADQKTVLAEIRNRGVSEEFEIDLLKAAESAAKDNAKAWRDDPVQQAEKTLGDVPSLTIEDPQQLSEDLAERAAYMAGLAEGGYADGSTILSGAEQEAFKAVFGKDTPIEIRMAMAGAAVRGLGADAVAFFNQVGGDEVTMYVGKVMALGGDEKLAMDIMRGQQMIDEGIVEVPSKSVRIETINAEVAVALQGIPNGVQAQGEIMKATVALYALDAQGVDPDSEAGKALLSDSLSKVLGQRTTPTGRKVGGIQTVMGQSTLLPMDQNGDEVEASMRVMLGGTPMDTALGMPIVTDPVMTETVWSAVSSDGTAPRFNGKPISPRVVDADLIRMVSIGGSFYRMEYTPPGGEPKDIDNGNGDIFIFDLPKLMEAME